VDAEHLRAAVKTTTDAQWWAADVVKKSALFLGTPHPEAAPRGDL